MQLEHSFTVPVGIDDAWKVLLDIEQVAPCMPGAALETVEGDDFTGSVKVKLGPIALTYKGKASFIEKDEAAHRAVIDAQGRDSRGNGTASAKVSAALSSEGATILAIRILFLFLVAILVNRFVVENRQQVRRYQALSETLEATNVQLQRAEADARRSERLAALGQSVKAPCKGKADDIYKEDAPSDRAAQQVQGPIGACIAHGASNDGEVMNDREHVARIGYQDYQDEGGACHG